MVSPTPNPEPPRDRAEAAEQRAKNAEQRVEELQEKIEALENTPRVRSPQTARPSSREVTGNDSQAIATLRQESMMDHLLNALDNGQNIGHYGRLVFAMVAHHFLSDAALIDWLTKDPDFGEDQAKALLLQVESRDYNPPRRERILEWQSQQEFPILPHPEDPDCGNLYRNLKFPPSVYEHIQDYQEEKIHVQDQALATDGAR